MVTRFSERLLSLSKGWVALTALVVFVVFTALALPGQAAQSEARTGAARQPDTSLFYTAAELYDMAEAFGPTGRQAYIQARFTFDVIWPVIYGIFLVTAIGWLSARAFRPGSPWRRLNLVPVLGVLFDYLENLSTSLIMARYPAQTPVVDTLAGPFTLVKWAFVGGSLVALLAVAALAAIGRLTARRSA